MSARATLEQLLDLGHLIVAAVKPPKTFDADKGDPNEAATACTSGQIRQNLLKSACHRDQDNSRLKVDDAQYASSPVWSESEASSKNVLGRRVASPLLSVPARNRAQPVDSEGGSSFMLNNPSCPRCSTRIDELTTRISMNQESLSQASFGNTISTLATKSSNFHKTSVEDGKAMEGCKQEIFQLRLEVTAWEDTRRKDEMRGSAPQRHFEQDMIERQWLVKAFRGINDKINCSRVIGSLLDIRPSGLSFPTKALAERNILFVDLADHIRSRVPSAVPRIQARDLPLD
ncbi:Uncharacterized protein HZ326_29059 [Fusarium oxysporum f. sp. albedinis]|nr:Uncharacterized protein HZ326_29059 [Fusarium oxysporum f. sp. albedinis]